MGGVQQQSRIWAPRAMTRLAVPSLTQPFPVYRQEIPAWQSGQYAVPAPSHTMQDSLVTPPAEPHIARVGFRMRAPRYWHSFEGLRAHFNAGGG